MQILQNLWGLLMVIGECLLGYCKMWIDVTLNLATEYPTGLMVCLIFIGIPAICKLLKK